MSPTSYQTAPPRNKDEVKLHHQHAPLDTLALQISPQINATKFELANYRDMPSAGQPITHLFYTLLANSNSYTAIIFNHTRAKPKAAPLPLLIHAQVTSSPPFLATQKKRPKKGAFKMVPKAGLEPARA
jgi:hypothetical protein